uniref:serine C-palmitoyltransferase n=1 Tax=Blastobotrys adeninivorans TaxID=409370 RepID=A0A060TF36_BLAAD
MDRLIQDVGLLLNSTIENAKTKLAIVPGSQIVLRYIGSSYQNDPARSVLELLLLLFAVRYFLASKYSYTKQNYVKLGEDEIDELVDDWTPEPLVRDLDDSEKWELDSVPVVKGRNGPVVSVSTGEGTFDNLINLNSTDVYGISNDAEAIEQAVTTVRGYGVGSCGPAGFYGNQDAHVNCEKTIAEFLGTEGCILYSQAFATLSSVIPCFMKRGDVIVADTKVNLAIQKGMQLSRASLFWYEHNDMESLEDALKRANKSYRRGPLPRRFIISEGLYENNGTSPNLAKIVELKKKYKYRLLLDESYSLGVLGSTGRGLPEELGIDRSEIDITTGSLAFAFGAAGGFCAGSNTMVEHQRITSLAYTFSATMPPFLANTSSFVIRRLTASNSPVTALRTKAELLYDTLSATNRNSKKPVLDILSRRGSPVIVLQIPKEVLMRLDQENSPRAVSEDRLLQDIVDIVRNDGVHIGRFNRLESSEIFPVDYTVRVVANAQLSDDQIISAAQIIARGFARRLE